MIHRRLHPLMIMLLLAGCAVGPDYQPPAPPAVTHWNDKGDSGVKSQTSHKTQCRKDSKRIILKTKTNVFVTPRAEPDSFGRSRGGKTTE